MAERGFSLVETLVAVALVALGTLGLAGATLSALQSARAASASARLAAAASAGIEVTRAVAATVTAGAPDAATLAWRAAWLERWQAANALAPWPLVVNGEWAADGSAVMAAETREGSAGLRFESAVRWPPPTGTP